MRIFAMGLFGALLFAGSTSAQICAPLPDAAFYPFSVGQPSNAGVAPSCVGTVSPLMLFASGNPALGIVSVSPLLATPGMPTVLFTRLSVFSIWFSLLVSL